MNTFETQQPVEMDLNDSAEELFTNDEWCAQEKLDGIRYVVTRRNGIIRAQTRGGRVDQLIGNCGYDGTPLPSCDFIIDGEWMKDRGFIAFDILSSNGKKCETLPYFERRNILLYLGAPLVRHAVGETAKRALSLAIKREGGEGIVFKKLNAPYRHGRTVDQVKLKNWRSDTFEVVAVDGSGIRLEYRGRDAGRCSGFAQVGDLVEVKFQERTANGKLRHPTMIGIRDDLK